MDAGLIWTAAGTVTALVVGGWQLRLQILDHRDKRRARADVSVRGVSVAAPTGRLPRVRGRRELLQQLRRLMRRPDGYVHVLAGMGGVGKSTVALALADYAGRRRWRGRRLVWWVSAADMISLTGGMARIALRLGATQVDLDAVSSASADGPDRLWSLLERARPGWLLIVDNADEPAILGAPSRAQNAAEDGLAGRDGGRVGDGTGWVRPSARGLVVISSRDTDSNTWGRHARIHRIGNLQDADAEQVLTDLAPGTGSREELLALSQRLGGLPLALHLAGAYLGSDFRRWTSAADYRRALDASDPAVVLSALSTSEDDPRMVVTRTWEISLDGLAVHGLPQARPLLRLLCCFAVATPIPVALLLPELLGRVLAPSAAADDPPGAAGGDRLLDQALRGLSRIGLLGIQPLGDAPNAPQAVIIHPVVADTNRSQLIAVAHADQGAADGLRETAADLMAAFVAGLDFDQLSSRAAGRLAVAHLRALLTTVAPYLDDDHLADLLSTIARVINQLSWRLEVPRQLEDLIEESRQYASRLGGMHPAAIAIQAAGANLSFSASRVVEAELAYRSVLAAQRRLLGEDHPETLETRHCVALMSAHQGRWAEAEDEFTQVLEASRRVFGDEDPHTLTTLHCLAWVAGELGRVEDAENLYRQVIAVARKTLGDMHPRTRSSQWHLAFAIIEQGRWDEAEAINRDILQSEHQHLGENDMDTMATRTRLAWIAAERGRWDEAETAFQDVLKAQQRILGEDHLETLRSRFALGRLAVQRGHWTQAETDLQKLLGTQEQLLSADHPDTLNTRCALALMAAKQRHWVTAETDLRILLETQQRVLGEGSLDTKATHTELAWAIARQGRWAEAERMFQLILGNERNGYQSLPARHGLAWVTARQGALSQAEAALRDIYHERSRLLGETHPDTLASLHDLAWVTAQQGRRAEAERTYAAVFRHREQILGKAHPDTTETEHALKELRQSLVTPESRPVQS